MSAPSGAHPEARRGRHRHGPAGGPVLLHPGASLPLERVGNPLPPARTLDEDVVVGADRYWIRAARRGHRLGIVVLAVLAGLGLGLTSVALTGARRADTAFERL